MKFTRQMLANGSTILVMDIEGAPGISAEWIGSRLTIGGKAYATAILSYNGANQRPDEALDGLLAIPSEWLNDAGKAYFQSADSMGASTNNAPLQITVKGAGSVAGSAPGLTTLQWGLIGAAAVLALLAVK